MAPTSDVNVGSEKNMIYKPQADEFVKYLPETIELTQPLKLKPPVHASSTGGPSCTNHITNNWLVVTGTWLL